MASTVNAAFTEFIRDAVNLDPDETKNARASRDWLVAQIHGFQDKVEGFPVLYTEKDIFFGSFARNTKIRELDDIDIMICMSAQFASYYQYSDHVEIAIPFSTHPLEEYCNTGTYTINSRKIVNKYVSSLKEVPQYEKSEIKRTMEAATLKMTSYPWNFDIVPCFFTKPESDGRDFYLIPDGKGNWKKTDPRKDRDIATIINKAHAGKALKLIRVMKFWNKRHTIPAMPSYLLETMILNYYLYSEASATSEYVNVEIPKLLRYIADKVFEAIYDLKNIQGDLNNLSLEQKQKISIRALDDCCRALEARQYEIGGDHKKAISKWVEIFGPFFPSYY